MKGCRMKPLTLLPLLLLLPACGLELDPARRTIDLLPHETQVRTAYG